MADKEFNADVSGIDERSEKQANEMEEKIWQNGGAVKIGIPEKTCPECNRPFTPGSGGGRAMNTGQKKWIDPKKYAEPSKKPWKTYGPPPKQEDLEKELKTIKCPSCGAEMKAENPETLECPNDELKKLPFMERTAYWVCPECGQTEQTTKRWE
jgi:predicted RNA-binding Zn-ribbon protein involved in translation (DUF1610 family)